MKETWNGFLMNSVNTYLITIPSDAHITPECSARKNLRTPAIILPKQAILPKEKILETYMTKLGV